MKKEALAVSRRCEGVHEIVSKGRREKLQWGFSFSLFFCICRFRIKICTLSEQKTTLSNRKLLADRRINLFHDINIYIFWIKVSQNRYYWVLKTTLRWYREDFVSTIMDHAKYVCSLHIEDLKMAASLHQGERCVVVLLCGTSGCGKSTLASLLGQNLGIATVVSTDSIRNMLKCVRPRSG